MSFDGVDRRERGRRWFVLPETEGSCCAVRPSNVATDARGRAGATGNNSRGAYRPGRGFWQL